MLERFAAQVLNHYIGQYVDDFNPENLSIGIVQGAVELEGLSLRKDALKELDLPGIEVKWGYIGKITLRIPSYKNYNEPWVIDINKLYLIVGPANQEKKTFNADTERIKKEKSKQKQLSALEDKWYATQGSSKSIYAIWHAYSSSIVTNIVENLQVRLFDLHIRYEDDLTLPTTFACGIHINVLSAQSTDQNWVPKTTNTKGESQKWKKMQLSDMSFYWNTKSDIFNNLEHEDIISLMEKQVLHQDAPHAPNNDEVQSQRNQLILQPVSGDAKFTRNCSAFPLRTSAQPRLALTLSLSSIPLSLEKTQYQQIVALASEIARWDKQRQHRSDKPVQRITENPAAWWNWAITSHLKVIQQKKERCSLSFALQRAKSIVKYTAEYKQLLNTKYVLKSQNLELSSSVKAIEAQLTFDEIRILRELVYRKIDEETKLKQAADKKLKSKKSGAKKVKSAKSSSWRLAGWLGWGSKQSNQGLEQQISESDEESNEQKLAQTLSQKTLEESVFEDLDDEELYAVFGDDLQDQDTNDTFLKRDSVFLKLDFSLESGTFTLLDTGQGQDITDNGIVSLQFDSVNLSSQWKPRYGTNVVTADLGGMILRDLTRKGQPFYELLKPAPAVKRPSSPTVITPPLIASGVRNLASSVFNNLFTQTSTKPACITVQDRSTSPVFSITYEKLPASSTTVFSDRLEVVTAPLSFTVVPGMLDRLKKFFSTKECDEGTAYELDSEVLSTAARDKYDGWMKRTQGEIRRSVKRIIDGKSKAKVSQKRWAISLDIFAPEILIPDDCSKLHSNILVLNLGHMTFDNHAGEAGRSRKKTTDAMDESPSEQSGGSQEENDDDDNEDFDTFVTPPNTPPSELDLNPPSASVTTELEQTVDERETSTAPDGGESLCDDTAVDINPKQLSEQMLREKMYERYHLNVSDLQVAVAPDASRLDSIRCGGKSSHHLVERFSVDLVVEKRLVPTYDPLFPALVVTGNLPHLTLHVSHSKVHCVMKCINQFGKKSGNPTFPKTDLKSPFSRPTTSFLSVNNSTPKLNSDMAINLEKSHSKQLACDFIINQISVVLEQGENTGNQILSVLEVSRIQTKLVLRPYDTCTSLSIYSLLLVDVMQQLGHDYELLLASHRNVFMDVGSGNMLDSGAASPFSSSQTYPSNMAQNLSAAHEAKPLPSPSLEVPTSNVLATVAENLKQFATNYDPFATEEFLVSDEGKGNNETTQISEHLIKLEFKSLKPGSPEFDSDGDSDEQKPCNRVNAYFSNLDVVFNVDSWITLLDFVHKLKPDVGSKKAPRKQFTNETQPTKSEKGLKPTPAHTRLNSESEAEEPIESHVTIDFKKLNLLLLRHIQLPDRTVGHKVATLTMHGAHVIAELNSRTEQFSHKNLKVNLDVCGSVAGLHLQDLSTANQCTEILSLGTTSDDGKTNAELLSSLNSAQFDHCAASKAIEFEVMHGPLLTESAGNEQDSLRKAKKIASEPMVANFAIQQDDRMMASESDLCDLMFSMDDENKQASRTAGFKSEARVAVKVASACYIHSPRLVAEILALIDETGDVTRAHMTSDTRQAYKDMARSIVDKVSDYSMAMLARSVAVDEHFEDDDDDEVVDDDSCEKQDIQRSPVKLTAIESNSNHLRLQVQMQSPIVALPKFPGSFELLIANLGQITVRNHHEYDSGLDALDVLNIDVVDMDLRSHRQKNEELAAKQNSNGTLSSSGPSIAKLKQESDRQIQAEDSQILHKTSLQLSVIKRPFIPNPKNILDSRSCCETPSYSSLQTSECCDNFSSCVGAISDKRMCVDVRTSSALTVTLSKCAYEQVLKTMDNVAYGGDIDQIDEVCSVASDRDGTPPKMPKHSNSAPILAEVPGKKGKQAERRATLSTTSQSTPQSNRSMVLFEAPGLEIEPTQPLPTSQSVTSQQTRKYTPISASLSVPSLIFQLSGDLSEGEQGIVKVTLQRFTGSYEKENRFGTALDLSLGSLDIEDLLQSETSPDRHIVVSYTPGCDERRRESAQLKTEYLSTSCPAFTDVTISPGASVSTSFPTSQKHQFAKSQPATARGGLFRPYETFGLSSGAFGSTTERKQHKTSRTSISDNREREENPPTPPSSPQLVEEGNTLVHIRVFLVDGKSAAYKKVYNRVNRRVDVDFNALDCKINLQTWVVLLDFFGIGTSPKKTYQLDPETEETFSWDKRLDIRSFYENQPDEHVNSDIDFTVKRFTLIFNKQEYELLKADITGLQSHVRLRDGTLNLQGQLGGLAVSDMSPNGSKYRDRFMFTGDRALDFNIMKYDEYDHKLVREFDISIRLRMASIRYVHTQRFQNEVVAYGQHFQQLQEVLGRMRAASVGQSIRSSSCRQARVKLDIETGAAIILIPESSHADRLLVANLGNINVRNEFLYNGDPGTLYFQNIESQQNYMDMNVPLSPDSPQTSEPMGNRSFDQMSNLASTPKSARRCILDVIHVNLVDMDLYTASFSKKNSQSKIMEDSSHLVFPTYTVQCNSRPLLKDKVQLELQMERNLEKEITHQGVPDTALCARLSSVYCALDHTQYWLVRGVLDHNAGEAIPDFPQPTAFLQPSKLQTVLTGDAYTGLSMDFHLTNVSIELLLEHGTEFSPAKSLGRMDFMKSLLSYRAFSNNNKTTNLSCKAFCAVDTRFDNTKGSSSTPPSVFTTILVPTTTKPAPLVSLESDLLQFEIHQRSGPGFMEFTALLNNMRVYVILDWLKDMNKYLIQNPNQARCDSLREITAKRMAKYGQMDSGNQRKLDDSGQLEPEIRKTEIKLNVTETEFVVVQDSSRFDTDAVILRSTAVLQFCPEEGNPEQLLAALSKRTGDLPLRCGLERLEVFSCQLDKENETALSIIDPVTVQIEVRPIKQTDLAEFDISNDYSVLDRNMLEVHVSELNMRVSYNDIMLFLAILKSLPTQAGIKGEGMTTSPVSSSKKSSPSRIKAVFKPNEDVVNNLTELGYSRNDVIHALGINNGDVTRAGSWLVDHATLQPNAKRHMVPIRRRIPFDVARISVKVDVARVCLIDDCAEDCDVPLAEFAVHALQVRQGVDSKFERSLKDAIYGQMGSSTFKLTGDYYNRMLSLWEPFLEPWRCNISWQHEKSRSNQSRSGTWNLKVEASDRFDVSVTSALIDTVKKTKSTWQSDYELSTDGSKAKSSQSATSKRIRHPFVPYVIRNLTGCPLKFATQTAALHETDIVASAHRLSSAFSDSDWTEVQPGEDVSFHFATSHEKQRHKRTGLLKLHQIRVKVGEWKTLQPVTVSRVGVYFRHAFTQINKSSKVYESPVPVRVVFSVALEGSAQKVVTVRSALAVKSRVKIPIQIQLEKQDGVDTSIMAMPTLDPGETQYIPLSMTSFAMRLRPRVQKHGSYYYSTTQIRWQTCTGDTKEEPLLVECKPSQPAGEAMPFHFAVCIQQKGFPSYEEVYEMLAEQGEVMEHEFSEWSTNLLPHLPGHTVIILPPVVISNLLPCDLSYYVKNTSVEGTLKPGMDATPHVVSLLADEDNQPQSLIIGCLLENFKSCRELIVPATIKNFQMRMLIKDYNDQTLILNVRILWRLNCSVKISVMAGYWIVNTTGLPIIVRQDGCQQIAAGQYDTHEQARSLQPLLFSYAHRENTYLCTMRLGKKAQMETLTGKPRPGWNDDSNGGMRAIPSFCERFSTDGGSCTRNLKMVTHDGTPNREFYIGISVRRGWGRYLHTHIVTVAPRFLLINRTKSKRLSFAQRHTISYTTDSAGTNFHLTIVPGSSVVFHWPRVDLDTLLCVRLADEPSCHWSGGFFIDRTDAFHVAIRLASGRSGLIHEDVHPLAPHCIFLSVEVTLVNATYCISLSDADPSLVPPPLRIDNVSSAPVIFKQVGTDEGYNTEVPAETQLAYACDEPSFPYHLQCSVKGSSQQVTLDMSNIGFEKQLYYENFIYITVGLSPTQTFYSSQHNSGDILVLDVQAAHRGGHVITLQPLRTGKRSQLWRMTSDGRIFHVGSSPPDKDAPSKAPSSQRNLGLVLDIGEMAFAVGRSLDDGIPLALKQTDERRRSTQTWSFGEDGRLHCRHKNLCARAGDLRVGSVVVLATFNDQRVPLPNELCSRHKMISGSGVLSLKVVRDGPTRVLRVVDIRQKRAGIFSKESDWTVLESDKYVTNERNGEASVQPGAKFTASLSMSKGVGISLVSNTPEELLYLTMNGVQMEVSVVPGEQIFSLRIQKLQIDNQLLDGHPAVMLCPRNATTSFTSSSKSDSSSTDPLISVRAVRQPSSSRLYQIFKSFSIDVGRLTVQIEERLLLKLLHFVGYGPASSGRDSEVLDEAKMDLNRAICNVMDDSVATATRFYFDTIRLSAAPMRLSVITTSRLIPELKAVKRALRFSLVQFERAPVAIQAYAKRHLFETVAFILADFSKHLRDQLKGQAAKILGSVDFLGNPIGLLTDVRAGMTGLAKGNLPNMVKHITHGISDSTAKVVSTLSGGLGEITMDEDYEDKRRAIQSNAKNAGGHVVAGLQGFMAGMIGGLTSVITQPVRGAQNDGTRGFIKGIGKGLVGTVTKPVTGVLDLASESASAVREISVSSDQVYKRARPVRCCHTFQGCLQVYSETQANGQQFLYALNRNDFSEHFYSLNKLSFPHHDNMLVLITSHKVYFVKDSEPDPDHVVLEVEYSNLINVRILPVHSDQPHSSIRTHDGDKVLLELTVKQCLEDRPAHIPFVRKGVVGDWKSVLSHEQSDRIDAKLAETGKKYPGFDKLWNKYHELLK